MQRKLLIRDLTLRDGQQSAFATRMNQSQVDRVLPFYKDANFYAMEVWGGAVPDSVMRFLGENPWDRLKKVYEGVGGASHLTALSRGRNLYGYAPYPDEIIDGFFKHAVSNGLHIMRIFDALNDVDNIRSSVKSIKKYGGMADCAVCYTIDPKYDDEQTPQPATKSGFFARLTGKKKEIEQPAHKPVFTDAYFLQTAKEMEAMGADMITIKDMSGLIPPSRVAALVSLFKKELHVPIDFHTHCTPGYGLGSVLSSIINGVDVVDTNIWYFSGGPAAPAIELVYLFCKKLGVELDVNMEAVAKINAELLHIRKELDAFDTVKQFPNAFNPLTDVLPAQVDRLFDDAILAAKNNRESDLLAACHAIEAYFNFPLPDEKVKNAEIPGGMYTNMVAQLKQFNALDILEDAMKLIPSVRLDAGLPPLVTPTSQIVGVQAVSSTLNLQNGRDKYANASNQFVALVKGEYGKTPVPVDPEFREKITGSPLEVPYDTSKYKKQENPLLPEWGNVQLAQNEEEVLLLELFPSVAANYLRKIREEEFTRNQAEVEVSGSTLQPSSTTIETEEEPEGYLVLSPMPGTMMKIVAEEGDVVGKGAKLFVLESMKMENDIISDYAGKVYKIYVTQGSLLQEGQPVMKILL
ncbi:MAG: carboxylase [Proteiniphilum sp.]|jgi:pyruvate/oxaloacetate carboxyltransferase|nr:carboxylase [Proteiniphilum sp.]MDD2938432.1 carboxylase [Proteiniphilum sp.]MDD3955328.1 carboxylase [Proteiniphilum sp.]NCB24336.1 carboxylase [Bacteroidia bacterium]